MSNIINMQHLTIFMSLLLMTHNSEAAKILGVYSMPAPSHRNILQTLFEELADRGHQVTVISPFPLKEKRENYKDIPLPITKEKTFGTMNLFEFSGMPLSLMMPFMWKSMAKLSDMAVESAAVQEFLNDKSQQFDLVITEFFFSESLAGFAHRFNAPLIGVVASELFEVNGDAVGDPHPYAYVPCLLLEYSNHMTFLERLHNTIMSVYVKIGHLYYHLPMQEAVMRKYFKHSENLPPLNEMVTNTSLLLTNSHFVYNYPRPHVPNVIQVGGFHIKPPKKLPQNLQNYLDGAKEGVIYFSMGSNLKSSDMPVTKREIFLKVFSKLKYKVLWKYEDDSITNLPKNVKIEKWLPQSDLLAHPNVKLFITHGGLLSTQEAIYHGVPLIGIPIFADQKLNVKKAVNEEYSLLVDFHTLTEEILFNTIQEITTNSKYKNNIQRLSRIYHDQPETPMERAIFWTEYVIRHKGAYHMHSAALDLAWYQYYLLDVIGAILLSLVISLKIIIVIIKTILRLIFRSSKTKSNKKSDKKRN